MRFAVFFCLSLLCCFPVGCDNPSVAGGKSNPVQAPVPTEVTEDQQEAGGIGKAVSDIVDQAKESVPTIEGARKWLNDTGEATGQTAEDTLKWVNDTFRSLSDQGMTTATDAQQWVSEDWHAMGAWEYKVLVTEDGDSRMVEEKLNDAGKSRWECYHVSDRPGVLRFYMKRQKRSYLKNLPLKDVLKLIPLLDGGDESP